MIDLLIDRVASGGILDTPCGSCYAGYTRIEKGERVQHGDIVGVVDDVLLTSVGTIRIGIVADDGRKYFARGRDLTSR